jgi:zinc protease
MKGTAMLLRSARAGSLLALAALAAGRPSAGQAQAPDRSTRPAVGEAPTVVLPPIQEFTLSNGLRVKLMEKHDVPLVQVNLLVDAGTVRDEAAKPGVASLTAAMLAEGAAGKSSLEIADRFEMMGARFGVGAGTHSATMTLRVPSRRLPEALALAADVVLRPDFPEQELERLRAERLTALVRRHDDPNAIAGVASDATLYGESHPYGRSAVGTEGSLRAIGTADLRGFHRSFYSPGSSTAVVVGDIEPGEARRLLEEAFGDWRRSAAEPVRVAEAPQVSGRTVYLVDKPGAAQTVVRLARIGVPRSSRDYYALEVMNVILGGSFTSRLNQNLREDKGYSYGARSGFSYLPAAGPWIATAAVQTQSTGPALGEFMKELRGMHRPIPSEEVERAKNFLAMRFPAGFQSVAGIAGGIAEMVQHDLPRDSFNRYVEKVLAVTREAVERVAREYIDPENVAIVVVGDREAIEQQVREQDLGEIRFLSVTDVLGPVPVPQ